jgi:hypothetical protein
MIVRILYLSTSPPLTLCPRFRESVTSSFCRPQLPQHHSRHASLKRWSCVGSLSQWVPQSPPRTSSLSARNSSRKKVCLQLKFGPRNFTTPDSGCRQTVVLRLSFPSKIRHSQAWLHQLLSHTTKRWDMCYTLEALTQMGGESSWRLLAKFAVAVATGKKLRKEVDDRERRERCLPGLFIYSTRVYLHHPSSQSTPQLTCRAPKSQRARIASVKRIPLISSHGFLTSPISLHVHDEASRRRQATLIVVARPEYVPSALGYIYNHSNARPRSTPPPTTQVATSSYWLYVGIPLHSGMLANPHLF